MPIMEYNLFKQIFNETIFDKSKADLLEKLQVHRLATLVYSDQQNPKQNFTKPFDYLTKSVLVDAFVTRY